jgi:hypothetical protein
MSMNNWIGDYDITTGLANPLPWTPGFKIILRASDMTSPGPSAIYVMLDERADSINDGYFAVMMDGFPEPDASVSLEQSERRFHSILTCWKANETVPPS